MEEARAFKVSTVATAIISSMFALLLVLLTLWVYDSYETSMRRTEERAIAASKIVATNASWITSLAGQALQRIDDALGPQLGLASDEVKNINAAVSNLPVQVQAYVVDRNGLTLFSTDPLIKPVDIRDREYFSALEKGAKTSASGLLVSRLSDRQIFVFSKRIERNGEFVGAAMVSFNADLFEEIWEAASLGENSTVSIIRSDGELVARYPAPDGPLNMSNYVLFTEYLPSSPVGTYVATSPADGAHRVVAYRAVAGTELVALASSDYGASLARFRSDLLVAFAVLSLAATASATAGWWVRHLINRLEEALEDNRLILREIHHRVKNNFQGVQSVIRMEQLPPETQKSLSDRIGAMIAVHEQIYDRDEFNAVSARELIPSVVDKLLAAYANDVSVVYDIDETTLKPDQATAIALLVNEIVTNSLKYAFPSSSKGRLEINLGKSPDSQFVLTVADDGVGFDPSTARKGMGSRLIRGVMSQLRGTFKYEAGVGTRFSARFQLD